MRTTKIIMLFIIAALPFHLFAQSKQGYEINGHIDGLQEGEKCTMSLYFGEGMNDFIKADSGVVKNGRFHITGIVKDGPRFYTLNFSKHYGWCTLFVDNNQNITITASGDAITHTAIGEYAEISGSPTNIGREVTVNMERLYLYQKSAINTEIKKIADSVGFDPALVGELITSKWELDHNYIQTILSYQTPFTQSMYAYDIMDTKQSEILFDSYSHEQYYKTLYDSLNEAAKNSFYGKKLKEIIPLIVNEPMPGFNLPDPDGKLTALKDITTKSKLTLVWFWASNSVTREDYEKENRILYSKYHDKGLNVIAVSADTSRDDWTFMIHQKKYPWINVSDLKGWGKGSIINDVYQEGGHSIPNTTNVLVDNTGKIVAWDPTGVELQWYLWKYLDQPVKTSNK